MPRRPQLFSPFTQQIVILLETMSQIMFILCLQKPSISPLQPEKRSPKSLSWSAAPCRPLAISSCAISPAHPSHPSLHCASQTAPPNQFFLLLSLPSLCTFCSCVWNSPPWVFAYLASSCFSGLPSNFPFLENTFLSIRYNVTQIPLVYLYLTILLNCHNSIFILKSFVLLIYSFVFVNRNKRINNSLLKLK